MKMKNDYMEIVDDLLSQGYLEDEVHDKAVEIMKDPYKCMTEQDRFDMNIWIDNQRQEYDRQSH